MPIYTSIKMTIDVAQDSDLEMLLLKRDRETFTNQFDEAVSGTVDIATSTTYTVPMSHMGEGQFLYVETTQEVQLHFSGGSDNVSVKPATAGSKTRFMAEETSFTSLTIENLSATDEAPAVFFMVLGT